MVLRRGHKTTFRGHIGIETRGQSSLRFPKKSWSIELQDRAGDNRDASLLGMPAEDDWVLHAPYSDKTLMRNVLAYKTARGIGRFASRTRLVEVRLNGRYHGVYVLMEKLKLHDDRVDVELPGQLLEWTADNKLKGEDKPFRLPHANVPVLFNDPERRDLAPKQRRAVRRSLKAADRALHAPGFADPLTGWRRHLDESAAVDFVLLNELFKNQDAFYASTYLTSSAGSRWAFGPVWDFDISSGNAFESSAEFPDGFMTAHRPWASRLYADPAFVAAVTARWTELRMAGLREDLLASVAANARLLTSTDAARRNFRRWPVLGKVVWPNPSEARDRTTYGAEVAALTTWLEGRIAWLDAHVHELASTR